MSLLPTKSQIGLQVSWGPLLAYALYSQPSDVSFLQQKFTSPPKVTWTISFLVHLQISTHSSSVTFSGQLMAAGRELPHIVIMYEEVKIYWLPSSGGGKNSKQPAQLLYCVEIRLQHLTRPAATTDRLICYGKCGTGWDGIFLLLLKIHMLEKQKWPILGSRIPGDSPKFLTADWAALCFWEWLSCLPYSVIHAIRTHHNYNFCSHQL